MAKQKTDRMSKNDLILDEIDTMGCTLQNYSHYPSWKKRKINNLVDKGRLRWILTEGGNRKNLVLTSRINDRNNSKYEEEEMFDYLDIEY